MEKKAGRHGPAGGACSCGWSGAQQREAPGWHRSGLLRAPGQALQPDCGQAAAGCLVRAWQRCARCPRPDCALECALGPWQGRPAWAVATKGARWVAAQVGARAPARSEGRGWPMEGAAGSAKPQRLAAGPQSGVAQAKRSEVCGCYRRGGGGCGGGGGARCGGERGKQGCGFGSAAEWAAPALHPACGGGLGACDVWCCAGARLAGVRHRRVRDRRVGRGGHQHAAPV